MLSSGNSVLNQGEQTSDIPVKERGNMLEKNKQISMAVGRKKASDRESHWMVGFVQG